MELGSGEVAATDFPSIAANPDVAAWQHFDLPRARGGPTLLLNSPCSTTQTRVPYVSGASNASRRVVDSFPAKRHTASQPASQPSPANSSRFSWAAKQSRSTRKEQLKDFSHRVKKAHGRALNMPESDYGDFDEDDFMTAGRPARGGFVNAAARQFAESHRPSKRRKIDGTNGCSDSEIENVAPLSRPVPVQKGRIVASRPHPGQIGASHGSLSSRPQSHCVVLKASSDSEDSAFDPAPFHPQPVPRAQLKNVNTKPAQASLVNADSRTGVGRAASRPVEISNHAGADSDSDDAFDPPALPVNGTRVSVRPDKAATGNLKQ
jgi:hypothetical protein